jgi:hypothetical protein
LVRGTGFFSLYRQQQVIGHHEKDRQTELRMEENIVYSVFRDAVNISG